MPPFCVWRNEKMRFECRICVLRLAFHVFIQIRYEHPHHMKIIRTFSYLEKRSDYLFYLSIQILIARNENSLRYGFFPIGGLHYLAHLLSISRYFLFSLSFANWGWGAFKSLFKSQAWISSVLYVVLICSARTSSVLARVIILWSPVLTNSFEFTTARAPSFIVT